MKLEIIAVTKGSYQINMRKTGFKTNTQVQDLKTRIVNETILKQINDVAKEHIYKLRFSEDGRILPGEVTVEGLKQEADAIADDKVNALKY